MGKKVGKLSIEVALRVFLEDSEVFVYMIENDNEDNDVLFDYFYIATFVEDMGEEVWGVGYSIESALENAEREWEREKGNEYSNPFREVLEGLKSETSEDDNNI